MIQIHYFASIREQLETDQEQINLPDGISNIDQLINYLQSINPKFDAAINANNKILVALNQTVVDRSHKISETMKSHSFHP